MDCVNELSMYKQKSGNALYRASVRPDGMDPPASVLRAPAPRASCRPRLTPLMPRVSRYAQSRSVDRGWPSRCGIELHAGVELRVNEPALGGSK